MIKIKISLEKIAVALFIVCVMYFGPGAFMGHSISHDYPFGYFSSDSFQHQTRAEAIKDMGNFRYDANYISLGIEKAIGRYPPLLNHLSVIFSFMTGLEVYDSIIFLVLVFPVVGMLLFYALIRKYSKNAAMAALPICSLIYSFPLLIGFYYGHWPSVFSQVFLIGLIWSFSWIDLEKSFFLVAVMISSTIMAHTSETIFGMVFIFIFFAARLIAGKLNLKEIKTVFLAVLISAVLCLYYIYIFYSTFGVGDPYYFRVEPIWEGNPGFYIMNFGFILVPIALGALFCLFKFREMPVAAIGGLAMLIGGFMNYVGFNFRSFQIRFFWPIYLSVFFGIGLYVIFKAVWKKSGTLVYFCVFLAAIIAFAGIAKVPGIMYMNPSKDGGLMNQYHWDAISWIRDNTEKDARIYFFYGDFYSQDALLRNTKRIHFQYDPEYMIKDLQNRSVKRFLMTEFPGDAGGGIHSWDGFMKMENERKKMYNETYTELFTERDICGFSYWVFDKVSRQQVFAQYNMLIASKIFESGLAEKAFENQFVLVLKNTKKGGDCIEEGTF